jgi:hypothetical protein
MLARIVDEKMPKEYVENCFCQKVELKSRKQFTYIINEPDGGNYKKSLPVVLDHQ